MSIGFFRLTIFTATVIALGACSKEPVAWSDIRYSLAGTAGGADSTEKNSPTDESADSAEVSPLPIPDPAVCRASIRLARAAKSFYAVWWSVRRDSSAWLLTSRSDDGGAWTHPVAADTTDAGKHGCARPAPSIAVDLVSGYVHLAYFLEPASGAGVFAIHSMDRDSSFHSPVAMVFGARPSNTSIAAEGDRVAVVYEDPNSARPQIFIALSRTMGHLFELRLPVSEENGIATDPSVKLRGTKLEVTWTERSSAESTRERHASRTGTWK
jgi:hypothetical protein